MSRDDKNDETTLSPRAREQRERILAAAQHCFVKYGFHAASMANIAEAAAMSAGLIYRYFPNKSSIVLAIIERQSEMELEDIRALGASTDPVDALMECFVEWSRPRPDMRIMNAALFLETSAEATRDKQVATAIHHADELACTEFRQWLEKPAEEGGIGMSPAISERRSLALMLLVEGLAVRAARDPKLDTELLREALAEVVHKLMEE
ncbi:TetR/AcrR family transcriptional regulator [Dyella sp. SG609]|uniref:TetR/AcrR family transcriptional regulator n=1 Tax=Dyella sp. SG609 TaxID=2587018 RepID=UPI0014486F95|nr:TetR/AcrR family transcriptional regulator [Dyella sp. SG609]NKJ20951.1 AcrR family transcriptional regulator [Dyella sp. SG609]